MTKKTWIIWALFLVVPGLVGLCIHVVLNDSIDSQVAESAEKNLEDTAVKEYLRSHDEWSNLSAGEKANNPWGFGEYGGVEIQKQLEEGQYDRLISDLPDLEKGLTHYPDQLADVLYGSGWEQEVENYQKDRFSAEVVLIGSIFLLAGGCLILVGGTVKLLVTMTVRHRFEDHEEDSEESEIFNENQVNPPSLAETIPSDSNVEPEEAASESESDAQDQKDDSSKEDDDKGYFQSAKKVAHEQSTNLDESDSNPLPMKPTLSKSSISSKVQKDSYFGWAIDEEDSTELETLMTTEPLTKELTELTEEVSAIRQFAAQQQDQMRKLQDGYDWMIIRRFCLRVIRCIDNIDDRIVNLEAQGEDASVYLEDIRDELIFALESSGIEQFKPDLNIPFRGLEKYAEAVRERVFTEDSQQVGCIAQVTRPGYQYLVNDDDVKIVRCAQVKLYEAN